MRESQSVHRELILAFQNDFAKYAPRANHLCLSEVFSSVAKDVGNQIKYSHLAQDFSGPTIKNAFTLLSMAQVITPIPINWSLCRCILFTQRFYESPKTHTVKSVE